MALEKTTAAIAELQTAANNVVAALQSAEANADVTAADETAAAAIQQVTDQLNNAVTPPSA